MKVYILVEYGGRDGKDKIAYITQNIEKIKAKVSKSVEQDQLFDGQWL